MSKVVAIVCGDIHLCHNRPSCRADEDWYGVMGTYLKQLREIQEAYDNAPILVAGDVFDKWKSPPQLINFAIKNMPKVIAIPGQHDLPYHGLEDLEKSAYHTLIEAGIIEPLFGVTHVNGVWIHGFPWGVEVSPMQGSTSKRLKLALVHAYIWKPGLGYPGAPEESKTSAWTDRLRGYDVAVFGDNHQHFTKKVGKCLVWNCGCFLRRKTSEISEQPCVGLVYNDGDVKPEYFNTSGDKFVGELDRPEKSNLRENPDLLRFMDELDSLDLDQIDYRTQLRRAAESAEKDVRDTLFEILED